MFSKKPLTVALLTAFAFQSNHSFAQESVPAAQADNKTVERVQVTGSRIKRVDMEGPAPITVISAQDLTDKGFNTAFEAIQSLTANTGTQQGQGYSGGFTQNAETVNLRGLGPNRTLVLLNGKRVANYPRAFNGQNNVFNLATIPMAAVERIDIVSGGASAIYGSDAMAGVMNIITKKGVDENSFRVRGGMSGQGDAKDTQMSFVTGGNSDELSYTLALDYSKKDALFYNDRQHNDDRFDLLSNRKDLPGHLLATPRTIVAITNDGKTIRYMDPTKKVCDQFSELTYANRAKEGQNEFGYYCGADLTGNTTILNDRENASIFGSVSYEFNSDHAMTANILLWNSQSWSKRSHFWDSRYMDKDMEAKSGLNQGSGYFKGTDGLRHNIIRNFLPSELGDKARSNYDETMINATVDFNGTVLEDYSYNAYVSHSLSKDKQDSYQLKREAAAAYYIDYDPVKKTAMPKYGNLFKPLTGTDFDQIFGLNNSKSDNEVSSAGVTLSGDTVELPAGPISFAVSAEFERTAYDMNVHPRTLGKEGQGWSGLTGTEGEGSRNRSAAAVEFNIPVIDTIEANIATRYDRYNDATDVGGAPTYQFGLTWKPLDTLMFRANHGTSFRAPDLHQVFADPSGSYSTEIDELLSGMCNAYKAGTYDPAKFSGVPGADIERTCLQDFNANTSTFMVRSGEKGLKEETGYSSTVGLVWEIVDDLNLVADVYKLRLEDEVVSYPSKRILKNELECYTGVQDKTSKACQDSLQRITRNPQVQGLNSSYKLKEIRSSYINAAMREQTGVDVKLDYGYDVQDYGRFTIKVDYTHVLSYKRQQFAGDAIEKDYRDDLDNDALRSKITVRYGWQTENWRYTLEQFRFGSTPNDVDTGDYTQVAKGRLKPWNFYNLGVTHIIDTNQNIRLGVNNLLDSKAPTDASFQSAPYFNNFVYPITTAFVGREFSLEYNINF
jgi:outer membrane receptor protein involved in Fe transport